MIQDAWAFRSETLPEEMHHREGKVQQLTNALNAITRGMPGIDALITGP